MDASDRANKNGNGHADSEPVSLPSAAVPPAGGPVEAANGASSAGSPVGDLQTTAPPHAPEPLVVLVDPTRDPVTGRMRKGFTANPKGRPPGIPNRNAEIYQIVNSKELREVWKIAKDKAKAGDYRLVEFLLERATVRQTPETAGIVVHAGATATANASASAAAPTHPNDRVEELRDPGIVDCLGDLADRIAERRRVARLARGNGN